MKPFVESNDLLGNAVGLQKRMRDDGYVFLRNILPRDEVLALRRSMLEICRDAGWLRQRRQF